VPDSRLASISATTVPSLPPHTRLPAAQCSPVRHRGIAGSLASFSISWVLFIGGAGRFARRISHPDASRCSTHGPAHPTQRHSVPLPYMRLRTSSRVTATPRWEEEEKRARWRRPQTARKSELLAYGIELLVTTRALGLGLLKKNERKRREGSREEGLVDLLDRRERGCVRLACRIIQQSIAHFAKPRDA